MKRIIGLIIACQAGFLATAQPKALPVTWVDTLTGDFSFANKWEYYYGIKRNKWNQPVKIYRKGEEPDGIFEEDGRIKEDSIESYYKTVDTTHWFYTMQWESNCYAKRTSSNDHVYLFESPGRVYCSNERSGTSNCKLRFVFFNDSCTITTLRVEIDPTFDQLYKCVQGTIKVDQQLWKQGILKAEFDVICRHVADPKDEHFYKGKLYVKLKNGPVKLPTVVGGNG